MGVSQQMGSAHWCRWFLMAVQCMAWMPTSTAPSDRPSSGPRRARANDNLEIADAQGLAVTEDTRGVNEYVGECRVFTLVYARLHAYAHRQHNQYTYLSPQCSHPHPSLEPGGCASCRIILRGESALDPDK